MDDKRNRWLSGIDCSAVKCSYNEDYRCTAEEIHVGSQEATSSTETMCDTFIEK